MEDLIKYYLSPDGGADSAGEGTEADNGANSNVAPETPPTGQENGQLTAPKYFSQINPTKAQSEEYKGLYQYQKLDDLTDAVISLKSENDRLKAGSERSIVIPEKEDLEGMKAFKAKLGIPDDETGYKMENLTKLGFDDSIKKEVARIGAKVLLNEKQMEAVGLSIAKITAMASQQALDKLKERRENFDTTLQSSYKGIDSETDRKIMADKDKATYNSFAEESGLKELLERTGLNINADFVKGIASYARKHSGTTSVGSYPSNGSAKETSKGIYGKEFNERYGIKN